MPPPKSQNQRQLRKRYSSNGWSLAVPRNGFQSTVFGSMFSFGRADRGRVAVPGEMDLVNLAELARLDDLVRLLHVRHDSLLRADLHDALVLVLGLDDTLALPTARASAASRHRRPCPPRRRRRSSARASGRACRSARRRCPCGRAARGSPSWQVPSASASLRAFGQMDVPDVADRGDLARRESSPALHQLAAAAARADAADVDRLIGGKAFGRRAIAGGDRGQLRAVSSGTRRSRQRGFRPGPRAHNARRDPEGAGI